MPFIVDATAAVACAHQGTAVPTSPFPRVKLSGQAVVIQTDPYTIAGCTNMPGPVLVPCVTITWTTAATRVKAGGLPVLLQSSMSTCVPNGTPAQITSTQMRVQGQ